MHRNSVSAVVTFYAFGRDSLNGTSRVEQNIITGLVSIHHKTTSKAVFDISTRGNGRRRMDIKLILIKHCLCKKKTPLSLVMLSCPEK